MPLVWNPFCNRFGAPSKRYQKRQIDERSKFEFSQYADTTTCLVEDASSACDLFKKLDLFRLWVL